MVEVIHEVDRNNNSNSGMGVIIGIVILIAILFFVIYFFGRGFSFGSTTPQVNIPDHVNVNVQQQKPAK